jgi:hypothetical protein
MQGVSRPNEPVHRPQWGPYGTSSKEKMRSTICSQKGSGSCSLLLTLVSTSSQSMPRDKRELQSTPAMPDL